MNYLQRRSAMEINVAAISGGKSGIFAWLLDRVRKNARVITEASAAFVLVAMITFGVTYFAFQQLHRERLAALDERIASQEALLSDYRTKLKGATPEVAENQIELLRLALRDVQTSLDNALKTKPAVGENPARDSLNLYQNNTAVASVREPKFDFDKKTVTFAAVTSAVSLGINKSYEFRDWKLTCGGTKVYGDVGNGAVHEFSYSPLTCKIVGNR